ncbi:MAG TPA: hypothetical protein VLN59_07180 [Burkholderiales bacterium]|nr:hypothetical protein [Burkholderiales bacterium]
MSSNQDKKPTEPKQQKAPAAADKPKSTELTDAELDKVAGGGASMASHVKNTLSKAARSL